MLVRDFVERQQISPEAEDENGYTPLYIVFSSYRFAAVSYDHVPVVEYLLQKGVSVNYIDDSGDTCLFVCETRHMAEYLISQGADIHHRNSSGQSVHWSVTIGSGCGHSK